MRPSPLAMHATQLTVLSQLEGHDALRMLQHLTVGPGDARLGAPSAATIHPRRSRSLRGSRGEEGRIGSRALPLKDLTYA